MRGEIVAKGCFVVIFPCCQGATWKVKKKKSLSSAAQHNLLDMLNMLTGGGVSPTIKIDGCERERFSFFGILSFCLWFLSFVRLFAHSLALFFEMCFVAQQQRDGRSGGVLRKIDE